MREWRKRARGEGRIGTTRPMARATISRAPPCVLVTEQRAGASPPNSIPPLARVFLHGAHDPLLTNGTTERDSPGGRRGIAEDSELLRSCTYHRFKVRRRFFLRSGGVGFFFIRRRRPFLFRRRWHRWIRFGFDFAHGALEY